MSTPDTGLAAVHAAASAVSRADHDAALKAAGEDKDKAVAAARKDGEAEGRKAGEVAERARVKAILGSDHAKGREQLAQHFAFDTEMTAEQAVAALEKSPKAESPRTSRLEGNVPQPKVAAGDPEKPAGAFEAGRQAVLARKGKAA